MSNISEILNGISTLLVAIGTVIVLVKAAGLIATLSDRIKEWKD